MVHQLWLSIRSRQDRQAFNGGRDVAMFGEYVQDDSVCAES
jgi:hypothetical protein